MTTLNRILCAAMSVLASATLAGSAAAYDVSDIGSFHIGGKQVKLEGLPVRTVRLAPGTAPQTIDPNGEFHTGQMYVQYVRLKQPKAKYPLLMWHTGGITGVSWETKPDGQPGWMQYFLRHGHDVFVSDAVERGRASFSRFPEIFKGEPVYRDRKDAWEIFRIGPAGSYASDVTKRIENPGQKFPLSSFDQMMMQMVPRWTTTGPQTQAAYNALVEKSCPCVIMAHGQAGHFAFRAAIDNPDKVKAVIAIEPAFPPEADPATYRLLTNIPHVFVWGDYIGSNPTWIDHVQGLQKYYTALKEKNVPVEWLDLPAAGIKGNTHMIMMDSNSDQVADRIQSWMDKKGLMRKEAVAAQPRTRPVASSAVVKATRSSAGVRQQ